MIKILAAIKSERVYIIGLEGAISKAVDDQTATLTGLAAADIVRIGGSGIEQQIQQLLR